MNNILKALYVIVAAFSLFSCSSKGYLNTEKHVYGMKPTRIIWLQVPGLSEEYVSLLKFYKDSITEKTQFEKFHCLGKMWNFNISEIRPNARTSFISQMTGDLSVENKCSDYNKKPLWRIEERIRYKVGYFEDQAPKVKCEFEENKFFKEAIRWRMTQKPDEEGEFFHADKLPKFKSGVVYYDRSCGKKGCHTSFEKNIKNTFTNFIFGKNFYFYIARINELETLIKRKKISEVYLFLKKLDGLIAFLKDSVKGKQDALILLTSAATKGVELPSKGKDWRDHLARSRSTIYRKRQTQSLAMAYGARAESFCGMFQQADIPERILSAP